MEKPLDEELLAHARICISKLSSDFKSNQQVKIITNKLMFQKILQLENETGDNINRFELASKDLSDCRLQIQQLESKNKTYQETINSQDKAKRQLEDDIDALNAKLAGLSKSGAASNEAQQEHQKQMAQLRDQIALKNGEINKLKVIYFNFT